MPFSAAALTNYVDEGYAVADFSLQSQFPRCKSCRFWAVPLSDYDNVAECRRNPPSVAGDKMLIGIRGKSRIGNPVGPRGIWPLTNQADGCGQHEPDA